MVFLVPHVAVLELAPLDLAEVEAPYYCHYACRDCSDDVILVRMVVGGVEIKRTRVTGSKGDSKSRDKREVGTNVRGEEEKGRRIRYVLVCPEAPGTIRGKKTTLDRPTKLMRHQNGRLSGDKSAKEAAEDVLEE